MWRKFIPVFGAALLTVSSVDSVAAQPVPFEQKKLDNRGGSDLDVKRSQDAVKAIEAQRDAGRGANDAFDDLWATNVAEDSIYYKAIIGALAPITGIGFFFWVILTWYQWNQNNERPPWQQLAHPIVTVFLLFNGGQYLAVANQSARAVIQNTTQSVFDFQIKGVEGRVHLQRQNTLQAYRRIRKTLRDRCRERDSDIYDACMANMEKTTDEYLAHKRGEDDENFWEQAATEVQSVVLDSFLINDLSFLSNGFFLILEWAMVGLAMIAPFLVAMHLIPKGRVGMSMLLGGYIALLTASFTFATLSVGAAAFLASATAGQPIIYLYITALINPIISLTLGYFGFNAFLMAPTRAFSMVSRVFRRF